MKKFFFIVFSLLLCFSVFADDEVIDIYPSSDPVLIEVSVPSSEPASILSDRSQLTSDMELEDITVLRGVAPVDPSDTSGLKAVLLEFLGDYDPVIVEYAYNSSQGYTSYLREVQPDYVWMGAFLMLALFIWCLFRLGGSLWRR